MSERNIIVGKHYYANLYGIDKEKGEDEAELRRVVEEAAKLSNMHLIEVKSWTFKGDKGGVSVIALVDESHIVVHTWPGYNYATVDVYTCGEHSDPLTGIKHIIEFLDPEDYNVWYAERSQDKNSNHVREVEVLEKG